MTAYNYSIRTLKANAFGVCFFVRVRLPQHS